MKNHNGLSNYYLNCIHDSGDDLAYEGRFCPSASIYLKKMYELCDSKGIRFVVRSSPMMDTVENHDIENLESDIEIYGLNIIMAGYIDSIRYYPKDCFKDGVHFSDAALDKYANEIQQEMINH